MVQVKVNEGVLEGELVNNEYGGTFYSFKGIPYAQAPVGDLRFKAPQPPQPWQGVRSAKQFGPICPQFNFVTRSVLDKSSEDCLYLNIYTPDISPTKPLPVMFWIHGGGFTCGSGDYVSDDYGPEFLVRKDVILVTINYRLEILGFLCLDSEDVPGNAGMKDQVAALRWVKSNIASFGGDPENITIFGESAGGASVTYHLLSPMSKGLFKRAIAQSGVATNPWTYSFEPRQRALAFAKSLGFTSGDDKQLYEFFKLQPVENLLAIRTPLTFNEANNLMSDVYFCIVSEKKFDNNETFFHGDVIDALREGIHEDVDFMSGYTEHEGLMLLGFFEDRKKMLEQANRFPEFFVPKHIKLNCTLRAQLDVGRKLKNYHFGDANISMDDWEKIERFLALETFVYGIVLWQKMCAAKKRNNMFTYKFISKSKRNMMTEIFKINDVVGTKPTVCHADDLFYLFNAKNSAKETLDMNSKEFKMIDATTTLWTNFAKYGNPTPDDKLGVQWTPYTNEQRDCLEIGEELSMSKNPDREDLEFWEDIYKKYLPHYTTN